jgi:hypothetical protein
MRNLYIDLHFVTEKFKSFSAFYRAVIAIIPLGQCYLDWWDKFLTHIFEERYQTPNFSMLAVAWGDGSGS